MKKIFELSLLAITVAGFIFVISCGKAEKKEPKTINDDVYVNSWILDTMNQYYYWYKNMPYNLDKNQSPKKYFYSLLYKYGNPDGDRFSWIRENYADLLASLSGVNSGDIGFEYMLRGFSNSKSVWGEVLYVKPHTPASEMGVKRGNIFFKINGIEMDTTNYKTLLEGNSATMEITFAEPYFKENSSLSYKNEHNVQIMKIKYSENPVFLDTVYLVNGSKVGYLIYNFFSNDDGDGTGSYDKILNNVFGKFKAQGIDNLVVDLRYNSGGSTLSATRLASMICKNNSSKNDFYILNFNDKIGRHNATFVSLFLGQSINNIGAQLNKVCFITSKWSASSSEMLINGLMPYMKNDIIVLGQNTVGKSYASISFYNREDPRNKWGIQPLVAVFTNSVGTMIPVTGIIPDFEMSEINFIPKKQLGDINEGLLNTALSKLTGSAVTQRTEEINVNMKVLSTSINKKAYSNKALLPDLK